MQPYNDASGAVHAAALLTDDGGFTVREDVGRHNAIDKAAGAVARAGARPHSLLVTSRASYEVVHKAAEVGCRLVAAISAPTALAVQLATRGGHYADRLGAAAAPDGLLRRTHVSKRRPVGVPLRSEPSADLPADERNAVTRLGAASNRRAGGQPAAGAARHPGSPRLGAAARRAADRLRAQPVARRSARRAELLPLFSAEQAGRTGDLPVSRRSLPGGGRGERSKRTPSASWAPISTAPAPTGATRSSRSIAWATARAGRR